MYPLRRFLALCEEVAGEVGAVTQSRKSDRPEERAGLIGRSPARCASAYNLSLPVSRPAIGAISERVAPELRVAAAVRRRRQCVEIDQCPAYRFY